MALGDLPVYAFIEDADYTNEGFKNFYGSNRGALAYDEGNDQTRLTIDAGYIDPQKQIQNMILAGEKLNSYREYDEEEALSNDEYATAIAQIRHPNTDITDIETYTTAINNRMATAKSEAERKAAKQSLEVAPVYKSYDKQTEIPAPELQETT